MKIASRFLARAAVISAVASFSLFPTAALSEVLYGVTFDEQLITIDTTTGAGTLVGTLSSDMAAFGLAVTSGKLYTFDQTADLLRELDPATGATVTSIDLGLRLIGEGGLDFRSDGVGFIHEVTNLATSLLYNFTLDPGSGSLVASSGSVRIDGLAFDSNDVLYALGLGVASLDYNLYTVNQLTGSLTLVGPTGVATQNFVGGLDFSGSTLYAVMNDSLYALNALTGAATLIGSTGFQGISGIASLAASNQVPEPATLALLGVGLAGLGFSRRKHS